MEQRTRTVVAVSLGAIAGFALGALCMYLFLIQPFIVTYARSGYSSAVAEAKQTATELRLLREGDTSKLAAILEAVLDTHILNTNALEETNPSWRDRQAEEAISSVREYRLRYPSQVTDKAFRDKVANALKPKSNPAAAP